MSQPLDPFAEAALSALREVLLRNPTALMILYEAPAHGSYIQGHAVIPNAPSVAKGLALTHLNRILEPNE